MVSVVNPQPGETIIDCCAAPGGKTLFMASCLRGQGDFWMESSISMTFSHLFASLHVSDNFLLYQANDRIPMHPKMWCLLNSYGPLLYMLSLWSIVIQSTLVPIILVGWIIEAWCQMWNGHNRTLFKFWTFGPHYFSIFLFLIWMKIFCAKVCLCHFFLFIWNKIEKQWEEFETLIHP